MRSALCPVSVEMDLPGNKENETEEPFPESSHLGDPSGREPHLKTSERYVIPGVSSSLYLYLYLC